ncbi:MAG: hypothetical protein JWQ87_5491 [Candidatus Sulfotelmatobacter sp.]|nr:hypothetical protein [Candidatus Sulfotelmatobacter sp.]
MQEIVLRIKLKAMKSTVRTGWHLKIGVAAVDVIVVSPLPRASCAVLVLRTNVLKLRKSEFPPENETPSSDLFQ